jgi:Methylamine utilisation protein MauE
MRIDTAISLTIALSVALLFAFAVSHKLRAWSEFQAVLRNYELLPDKLVALLGAFLVALEVSAVVLLVMSGTRAFGAALSAGLLAVYALAMAINLVRGRVNLDCGCLGFGRRQPLRRSMVVRNLAIAALVLVAALPTNTRVLEALDVVSIVGAVISLAFLYAAHALLQAGLHSLRGNA